jgi:ATP adenylyltransferase
MQYVTGAKAEGCVFCSMVEAQDDEANHILYRDRSCFVVLNAFPYNAGHLMVVPYAHVREIQQLGDEPLCEMMRLARLCAEAQASCIRPEGFNLGMNIGRAAGAGIDEHLHLHLVPRWVGDTNYMTTVDETRVVPEALSDCAARLGPVIRRLAQMEEGGAPVEGGSPADDEEQP